MTIISLLGIIGKIIGAIIIAFLGVVLGLFYKGIDRKLAARMQARVGPPIRQPFLDFFKLMIKENIVPENAVPWIFNGVPVMSLVCIHYYTILSSFWKCTTIIKWFWRYYSGCVSFDITGNRNGHRRFRIRVSIC